MGKKKSSKTKGQKLNAPRLRKAILGYFRQNSKKALSARQMTKKLHVANNKNEIQTQLETLVKEGKLNALEEGKFGMNGASGSSSGSRTRGTVHEGIVDKTRTGSAFIICEDLAEDVFVPAGKLEYALDGDRVAVEVQKRGRQRPTGRVVKIIKRARDQFLGVYHQFKRHGLVVPDNDRVPFDIFIHPDATSGATDGEKVIVRVTDWHISQSRSPGGEVIAVLGAAGSHDIEMKAILLEEGFNLIFPDEVIAEAESLTDRVTQEELAKRRDFRNVPTFTIDPVDAKDFDDALSYRILDNGNIEIGIHIADVTHYVKPGTQLDKEAYERSTSVYLVDRVLPMLPERLSNELCSLRPNEDSLCFSAVFEFDKQYKVVNRWFGKTIIHSDQRFSYEKAQEVIDKKSGPFAKELLSLNEIAYKLRDNRLRHGGLVFETDEVRFELDEHGVPIEILVKERGDTHLLIEDFMLLANREVATYMSKKGSGQEIPFVYRVHDLPDPQKLAELAIFAHELGFDMKIDTPKQVARSFNALAKAAKKNEALTILEPIAIRTMAKAEYHTDNIGHYGLAFTHYTHFTSPIRRYADVLVHRILQENLGKTERFNKEELQRQCTHISAQERKAQKAERNSVKYKQAEYLQKHIGDIFEGFVTGMIDKGIFVQLKDIMAEGLIGFQRFDEPFDVAESRLRATGTRTGQKIHMGDKVTVKVLDADPSKRQVELGLVKMGVDNKE